MRCECLLPALLLVAGCSERDAGTEPKTPPPSGLNRRILAAIRSPDVDSAIERLVPPEEELRKLAKPVAKRPIDAPPAWTLLNHKVYSLEDLAEKVGGYVADGAQSVHRYYLRHRMDPTAGPDAMILRPQSGNLVIRYSNHDFVAMAPVLELNGWEYVYGIWPLGHIFREGRRVELNLLLAPRALEDAYPAANGLWGGKPGGPQFDLRAVLSFGSDPMADVGLAALDALVKTAQENEQPVIAELRRTMGTLEPVELSQAWAVASHWLDLVRKTDKDARLELMQLRRTDKKHVEQMLAAKEDSAKWQKAHVIGREESKELNALAASVMAGLQDGNDDDLIMSSFNEKTRRALEALKEQLASLSPDERQAFSASAFSSLFPNREMIVAGIRAALESGAKWRRFHLEAKLEHAFGEGQRLLMRCEKEGMAWKVAELSALALGPRE